MPPTPEVRVRTLADHELADLVAHGARQAVAAAKAEVGPLVEALRAMKREQEGSLDVEEAAALLKCTARQVHEHHVPNGLPRYGPGRRAVFLRSEVFAYIRSCPLPPPAEKASA